MTGGICRSPLDRIRPEVAVGDRDGSPFHSQWRNLDLRSRAGCASTRTGSGREMGIGLLLSAAGPECCDQIEAIETALYLQGRNDGCGNHHQSGKPKPAGNITSGMRNRSEEKPGTRSQHTPSPIRSSATKLSTRTPGIAARSFTAGGGAVQWRCRCEHHPDWGCHRFVTFL